MDNYDLADAWVVAKGAGPLTAVVERMKPDSVHDRFVALREGLGMEVLPASGGILGGYRFAGLLSLSAGPSCPSCADAR